MSKHMKYKLKIDAYTPDTIPMKRLSEYMSDLAALLGESKSVHFSGLEAGSTVVAASIEKEAIPKVSKRVASINHNDAPAELLKAFKNLDRRLAADNATGYLSAFEDDKAEAIILKFPGKDRPSPLNYGVIRQQGSLDGIPVSVGGQDKTSHVILQDRHRTHTGISLDREKAMKIAMCLFSKVVRLYGTGSWARNEDGQWQLQKFKVDSFDILEDTPLQDVLEQMRATPNNGWSDIDDPSSFLDDLRNDNQERTH